jgi:hypothetical protein
MQAMARFELFVRPLTAGVRLFGRRGSGADQLGEELAGAEVSRSESPPARSPRPRRSLALMRLLDADCPSCRGFGCSLCYDTGLA